MSINGVNRVLSLLDSVASEAAPRSLNQPLPTPTTFDSGASSRLGEQAFTASLQEHKIKAKLAAMQSVKPPPPTMDTYRQQATHIIGGDAAGRDVLARNRAISGAYASLYLKNPEAFRWVGAAAHASGQVGLAIEGARLTGEVQREIDAGRFDANGAAMQKLVQVFPREAFDRLKAVLVSNPRQAIELLGKVDDLTPQRDLEVLKITRQVFSLNPTEAILVGLSNTTGKRAVEFEQMLGDGNKAIFDNIFPAALAYQHGGIGELRRLETLLPQGSEEKRLFTPLVKAFEDIDAGIRLKAQGQAAAGEALIREGNEKLINHEQRAIAQPVVFDKHPDLAFLMSPLAFGDFDADPSKIDKATASYFWFRTEKTVADVPATTLIPAYRKEVEVTVPTNFMKSIGDADARINWIQNDIFKKWYDVTSKQPWQVREGMGRIIETGRQAGGRY